MLFFILHKCYVLFIIIFIIPKKYALNTENCFYINYNVSPKIFVFENVMYPLEIAEMENNTIKLF